TKNRRKVFNKEMLHCLHLILEESLIKWDCKLVDFSGEENHIHCLFQYYPDLELSKLINTLKTISSRRLRQEFSEHLDKIYSTNVVWSGSYLIASCGGMTISTLKKYVDSQNSPEE
ncbi:MAG: IS200/IS605 family transposase, partial [Dolichospermum sp.]